VSNKRITKTQEDQILSGLSSRIDTLVNQKGGRPPGWPERGHMRGGMRFGGPPVGGPPPGGPPPF
jgi:hypothetical protein